MNDPAEPKPAAKAAPRKNTASHVRRGGSFLIDAALLRHSFRGKGEAEFHNTNLGFRVALVPAP